MTLYVKEILHGDTFATVCYETGSFTWHGTTYATDGLYDYTYKSIVDPGLDSIVTLHLTVLPELKEDTLASYCKGHPFEWYGDSYTINDPEPTHKFTSKVPPYCDSIVTLKLTELLPTDSVEIATIFTGQTYFWHGRPYTTTTTEKDTLVNAVGCDSVCVLMLTVLPQPKIEIIQYDIDSVIGCDSTTYDLTVTFEYTNLDGTLIVDYNGTIITPAFVPNSNTPQLATAKFEGLKADGATHTLSVKTTGGSHNCEASINVKEPQDAKIEFRSAEAPVQPYACGDHTYSVKVEVEFANGQGRDLIIKDWKGNITRVPTTATDTKIDTILSYEKHTPGGGHRYRIYFYGNIDCYVTTQFTEPAQPKIDITDYTATAVTGCDGNTYDMTVTFDYTNQDGILSVDLDGIPADSMPNFVRDKSYKQTATAKFRGLTADGLRHTLTVKTTDGEHNCEDSRFVTAPEAEAIITSVEVANVPENILCDQTEYDATVTVSMTSGNAIGKKIVITHEGINENIVVTDNPMVATIKMSTADATGLTMDAYFEGHPECNVTSDPFDTPKRLSCVKDYENICQGETYTWPVTNLPYTFNTAGIDTIVNALNIYDSLFVTVYPVPTIEEATTDTTIYTDDLPYEWNGEWFSEPQTEYTKVLQTADGCDYKATLKLTVKENNVEVTDITIAKQCAGEGALEIAIQHTGLLDSARLTFDNKAIQAGFVDSIYPIENDTVNVPYNARAGIFSVNIDLLFHGRIKHSKSVQDTLLFPSSVLEQGWYDAIFVLTHDYNGGYDFAEFQWYKKGQMLVGETGPYLYQPLEVDAEYSAMLTDSSGLQLMTCPIIIQPFTEENPYPTLVSDRNIIHVSVAQNALLTIYSVMGQKVGSYSLIDGDTQINAPGTKGIYLAEFVFESGQRNVIKFMVR